LWEKELNAKDIQREMFSVYGVKLLSLKTIPPWWQTFR
jgi:hypothetical protein